jgi:hypothetical protein
MHPYSQRDPIEMLRSKMTLWGARGLKHEEVVYILKTAAREILPAAGLQGRCRNLETFATWCLHDRLDRTQLGGEALVAIAEAVPLHDDNSKEYNNEWLGNVVNGDLSFHLLRLDLLAFCRQFNMPDGLVMSWEGWKRFALPLAEEISGRPVSISDTDGNKRIRALRERLQSAILGPGYTLRSIKLALFSDLPFQHGWCIETTGPVIVVATWFGELQMRDSPVPKDWVSPL